MNSSFADTGRSELDWERWTSILRQYAEATGLVVSVYDEQLKRRIGPLLTSRLARTLFASRLWASEGPGSMLEQKLAMRCMASGHLESDTFCTELNIKALPISLFGQTRGAIVFGWVFFSFPTSLTNHRIAREVGLSSPKLWTEVRLESPISPIRMAIFCELLNTLVASNIYQTEAIEELQALSRMRDVFLAQVSHDLRTPLSSLLFRIEALLLGRLDDPKHIRAVLKGMRASVQEEAQLIEDLIDVARTRTGQLRVKHSHTELLPILTAAVAAIQPQADRKNVQLHMQGIDTIVATPIWADKNRLQQVFWNLLSNAVKFMPASGGIVTIDLRIRDYEYEVSVEDSGAGIDEALLPRLFDAFVKRENNNEKGLGLGLSIVKHIVELHGGTVRAYSDGIGQGATFTVILPRRHTDEPIGTASP